MAQEGIILTESQLSALEKARQEKETHGEIETEHPGYPGAQDTYYVGTIKGVGRIYQQAFIDTYSRVATAKLYTDKSAITAADLLNDRVVPFFDEQGIRLQRILPQTNGICEQFYKTLRDECYSLLFRKKLYRSLEELQVDLDAWLEKYNRERPHSGRYCYGKTPWETFQQSRHLALEKDLSKGGGQPDNTTPLLSAVR